MLYELPLSTNIHVCMIQFIQVESQLHNYYYLEPLNSLLFTVNS